MSEIGVGLAVALFLYLLGSICGKLDRIIMLLERRD